jgi:hypothetical protein
MVVRMISGGWIITRRCSWITVYVLCCNAQVNLIVIFMTCTCIVTHSLFCQLPNCNLFTQHVIYLYEETPLVNCGPRSILLHLYYHLLQVLFTFRKRYFTSLQTNTFFHIIHLILYYQQTGEIDYLTVSWGKVFWLCCVQVPRCWLTPVVCPTTSQLVATFGSDFFLLLVRLNLGFILRENLPLCSSYLPLGVSQLVLWDISLVAIAIVNDQTFLCNQQPKSVWHCRLTPQMSIY